MALAANYLKYDHLNPTDYEPKYLAEQVKTFVEKWGLNLNPDFQRGHVWTHEQRVKFLEYWMQGGPINPIYLNWPEELDPAKGYTEFVIVDGLQRLTAFLMFVNDEITVFNGLKYSDITDPTRLPSVPIAKNRLPTRKEVLEWYFFMNSGGTPHSQAELDRVSKLIQSA